MTAPERTVPREWWICQTDGYDGDAYNSDPATWDNGNEHRRRPATHVIEKRAYDLLSERYAFAIERVEQLEKEIEVITENRDFIKLMYDGCCRDLNAVCSIRDEQRAIADSLKQSNGKLLKGVT